MRLPASIVLAGLAIFGGCHDRGSDVVFDPANTWYYRYENGHPLAVTAYEPAFVAAEDLLLARINDHRVAIGGSALIDSAALRDLARAHSIHMAIGDFTWSVNPEGDDPGERAGSVGMSWTSFEENVVYDLSDPDDVYREMINDPWMHDAIDDARHVEIGVGYEHDSGSRWNDYWTVDFREP